MQHGSVPPPDDRTPELRAAPVGSPPRSPPSPSPLAAPSTPASTAEASRTQNLTPAPGDFLFHFYRGSELFQENRLLEAQEELESALAQHPRDPKGQDLLGTVYFRLGSYPRALQIYEGLEVQFPRDSAVKINLALCYLKVDQPERARRVLEDAVRARPDHKRAWGYLGLVLQRLGDFDAAEQAFERGEHPVMARRVREARRASTRSPAQAGPEVDEGPRWAAEAAFSELESGDLRFALATPSPSKPADGPWRTLEPGAEAGRSRGLYSKTLPPPGLRSQSEGLGARGSLATTVPRPPPPSLSPIEPAPLDLAPGETIALHPSGALLVRASDERPFALRLDALRVIAGPIATRVLHRRSRDADTSEILGSLGSPLVRVSGAAELVLSASALHTLELFALDDGVAFVREDALLGFDLRLGYENGKLASDAPNEHARAASAGLSLVQLRGRGALALELPGPSSRVRCTPGRSVLVRREWLVGWLGRLVPRALASHEGPNGQRGLVALSGDGTVLVSLACPPQGR